MTKPRRLGRCQLDWLALMTLGRFQVIGDKLTASLVRRGFAQAWQGGADMVSVTPAGLRALADALEAGRIEIPSPKKLKRQEERNGSR